MHFFTCKCTPKYAPHRHNAREFQYARPQSAFCLYFSPLCAGKCFKHCFSPLPCGPPSLVQIRFWCYPQVVYRSENEYLNAKCHTGETILHHVTCSSSVSMGLRRLSKDCATMGSQTELPSLPREPGKPRDVINRRATRIQWLLPRW